MNNYGQDAWGRFCETFDKALFDCLDKGNAAKLTVADTKGESVTVEIYRTKGDMKKLQDIVLKAVKQESGIDIVK